MATLVTGAAGFIGFHCARALLEGGDTVVGVDNFSSYYSIALKQARVDELKKHTNFSFRCADLSQRGALESATAGIAISRVIHLAAQPGVGYSLENPHAYVAANVAGHLNMLEFCRHRGDVEHIVYASSSSVYGGNTTLPFKETDRVDHPISLYAATKHADEMMSHTYAHLFGMPLTGLRFFTVYGPWGRPDMAVWLFTEAILSDRPIKLFNHGRIRRDFTFIDDVITGVLSVLERPPGHEDGRAPARIYNIGNNRSEGILDLIAVLEDSLCRKARVTMLPMQPGDIAETAADITMIHREIGFQPRTSIRDGIPRFVRWYRDYCFSRADRA